MATYIALIHKEDSSDYGVSFPDFPGCVTAGASLDEARVNAVEALAFHIEGLIEDGQSLPEPSDLAGVMRDRGNRDAVAVLVETPTRASKTVRVNITMAEVVLNDIDAHAEREGYSRSGLIAKATHALTDFSLNPQTQTILHPQTNACWRYDDHDNIKLVSRHRLDERQRRDLEIGVRDRLRMERRRAVVGGWADPAGRVVPTT